MEKCNDCVCLNCDANNKMRSTDPLNTCYGCDGQDNECNKPMTENDCLYQVRKQGK